MGLGYLGKWVRKENMSFVFILWFGILFEDCKGLLRFVLMIEDLN